jgi:hypothetical protein
MIYSLPNPEHRNYENAGGQLYKAVRKLEFGGQAFDPGTTLPFDGAGGTAYSDDYRMMIFFEQGWVDPIN